MKTNFEPGDIIEFAEKVFMSIKVYPTISYFDYGIYVDIFSVETTDKTLYKQTDKLYKIHTDAKGEHYILLSD